MFLFIAYPAHNFFCILAKCACNNNKIKVLYHVIKLVEINTRYDLTIKNSLKTSSINIWINIKKIFVGGQCELFTIFVNYFWTIWQIIPTNVINETELRLREKPLSPKNKSCLNTEIERFHEACKNIFFFVPLEPTKPHF